MPGVYVQCLFRSNFEFDQQQPTPLRTDSYFSLDQFSLKSDSKVKLMFEKNWLVSQSYMMKLTKTIEKCLWAILNTEMPSKYLVLT